MGTSVQAPISRSPNGSKPSKSPVEQRIGFRAKARKHFTNFIYRNASKEEFVGRKFLKGDEEDGVGACGSVGVEEQKELSASSEEFGNYGKGPGLVCSGSVSHDFPEEFICPISKDLMADPVIIASGTSYERRYVEAYFKLGHYKCFKTGEPLDHLFLTKNVALNMAIDHWCDSYQVPRPVAPDADAASEAVERACQVDCTPAFQLSALDTASSSDSSGAGSSSRLSAKFSTPEQIPEAGVADLLTSSFDLSRSQWQQNRSTDSEIRHHTWSGMTRRKFASSDSPDILAKGDLEELKLERSPPPSPQYSFSFSAMKNPSRYIDVQHGRGPIPLSLSTRPSTFSEPALQNDEARAPSSEDEVNEEVARALHNKLRHRHAVEQEEAVVDIRRLTRVSTRNRLFLCDADFLEVLVPHMQSRYVNVQINAVASIMNLTLERENKLKVTRAGAIPMLIDVLKSGHPDSQEHAAGAIFSLALNDENKMALGVLGAIPALVHVLRSGKQGARRDAAMALYHLSVLQMNKPKLIKAGAVRILVDIAKDERSDIVSRALLILSNIAATQEGRLALAEFNAVQIMVGLLTREDEQGEELGYEAEQEEESRVNWGDVREHAAATLLQLSYHNFRFKSQALQAGALEALKRLAQEGTPRAREKAATLLVILRNTSDVDGRAKDNSVLYGRIYRNNRGGSDEKADSAQF